MTQWGDDCSGGIYFKFIVGDETGLILVTAFDREARKYFDFIEPNSTYIILRGVINVCNPNYINEEVNNDKEIILNYLSHIQKIE